MSDNINLLKGSKVKRFQQEKLLRIFRIIAIVSLSLVVVFSALLFFINSRFPVESLRQEEADVATMATPLQKKAAKLFFAKNRIQDIAGITKKRTVFDGVIAEITKVIPEEIKIQSFNLDNKKFTLTIVSSSLLPMDILIKGVDNLLESKKIFSKVTLEGLTVDPKSGNYTISLSGDFL